MSEGARLIANHRVHVVPVVLTLADPPWQQDVWLDPLAFENVDHVFHTLFDDFCDADEPERWLGVSLRTEEEVALMRELGITLNAAAAEAPHDTDAEYLRSPRGRRSWRSRVVSLRSWSRTTSRNSLRCTTQAPSRAALGPWKGAQR
ncbi:SCO4402 family protein [Streptomyces caeruleatus]|uniref:SCO4402 family protein n=1 Tax=Streptomyces caeruleatus TaxID=661399 RepID=UPI001FC90F5C|nr:hypothetical protein [Streptomyces caeruleatus]